MALVNALGVQDGFGFSAGAIDYALNFTAATRPLLLVPVGLGYAAVYYLLFRFAIRRFGLATPGREPTPRTPTPPEARRRPGRSVHGSTSCRA